jgi:RNA recognition motif-containing protein
MSLPPHLMNLQANLNNLLNSTTLNIGNISNNINSSSQINVNSLNTNPTSLSKKKPHSKRIKKNAINEEKNERRTKRLKMMKKKWKVLRKSGGEVWEDPTLEEWPENDYRIFCGDLGNEVTDDILANAFRKYSSFQKARVIRDRRTGKSKGYGFISIGDANDYIKAMREMNNKYVGNRPIRLKKSDWKDRCLMFNKSRVQTVKFKKNKTKFRTKQLLNNNPSSNDNIQNLPVNMNMNMMNPNSQMNSYTMQTMPMANYQFMPNNYNK